MIILLEYIDLFTTCMNIMPGNHYSVDILLNALPTFTITEILLQFTHPFVINVHIDQGIGNACNMDFCLLVTNQYNTSRFILDHI